MPRQKSLVTVIREMVRQQVREAVASLLSATKPRKKSTNGRRRRRGDEEVRAGLPDGKLRTPERFEVRTAHLARIRGSRDGRGRMRRLGAAQSYACA
jgi:hypothetical protein